MAMGGWGGVSALTLRSRAGGGVGEGSSTPLGCPCTAQVDRWGTEPCTWWPSLPPPHATAAMPLTAFPWLVACMAPQAADRPRASCTACQQIVEPHVQPAMEKWLEVRKQPLLHTSFTPASRAIHVQSAEGHRCTQPLALPLGAGTESELRWGEWRGSTVYALCGAGNAWHAPPPPTGKKQSVGTCWGRRHHLTLGSYLSLPACPPL